MGSFLGDLKVQYLGAFSEEDLDYDPARDGKAPIRFDSYHQWLVLDDLYYITDKNRLIKIEAGTLTDFASVPKVVRKLIPDTGKMSKPALLHDWLYRKPFYDKLKYAPQSEQPISSIGVEDLERSSVLIREASACKGKKSVKFDIEHIKKKNGWSDEDLSRSLTYIFKCCKNPTLLTKISQNSLRKNGNEDVNRSLESEKSSNVGELKLILDSIIVKENSKSKTEKKKYPLSQDYIADSGERVPFIDGVSQIGYKKAWIGSRLGGKGDELRSISRSDIDKMLFENMLTNGFNYGQALATFVAVNSFGADSYNGGPEKNEGASIDPELILKMLNNKFKLKALKAELEYITGNTFQNLPKNTDADGFLKKYCGVLRRVYNSIDTPEKLQSYHIALLRSFKGDSHEYMRKASEFEKASIFAGNKEASDRMDQLEAMTYFMKKNPFSDIENTRQYREVLRKNFYPNKDYDLLSKQELKLTSWPGSNHKIAENKNDFFVPKKSISQNPSILNKETIDTPGRSWSGNNFRVDRPLYAQNLNQKPKTYGAGIVGEGFAKEIAPVNPLAATAQAEPQRASYGEKIVRQGLLAGNRPVDKSASIAQATPLNFFRGDQITGAGILGLNRPENLLGQVLADILKSRTETPFPGISQSIPTAGPETLIPGTTGPMIPNGGVSSLGLLNLPAAFFLRDEMPNQPIFEFGGLGQHAPATRQTGQPIPGKPRQSPR